MKNILLVDDEKTFLLSLSEGLRFYDSRFRVFTAENGQQAMDILDTTRIDLIITDLKMPNMDGFDLLMHAVKKYPDLPVIVMTAYANPDIERKLMNLGITTFFEKPLEFTEIAEAVAEALSRGRAGRAYGITHSSIGSAFTYLTNRRKNPEGGPHGHRLSS